MSSNSKFVQFRGMEAVMQAFDYRLQKHGVEFWAIFQGKELLVKGQGSDELKEYLEMIDESPNTYTLKVYEGVNSTAQIKDKTACDGSFNFRMMDEGDDYGQYSYENKRNKLFKRLELLEAKINGTDEEEETLEDVIIGTLKEPDRLYTLINAVKGLFGGPMQPTIMQNTMSGVQPTESAEQKLQRLGNAIDILEKHDAKIVDHLEKLAQIAQSNPGQFKFLINALETM